MSTFLTADQILAADDIKTKVVEVPEWGGSVIIKTMTGTERDKFEAESVKTKGGKQEQNFDNFRARLVAAATVDENGVLLFQNRHQIALLGKKSVAALQRLFNEIQELNGISDDDVDNLTEGFDKDDDEASTSA